MESSFSGLILSLFITLFNITSMVFLVLELRDFVITKKLTKRNKEMSDHANVAEMNKNKLIKKVESNQINILKKIKDL